MRLTGLPSGRRSKFLMLGLWLVLATVGGMFAAKLSEVQNNDALGALPQSAEALGARPRPGRLPRLGPPPRRRRLARDSGLTAADRAPAAADGAGFARYAEGGRRPEWCPARTATRC